MPKTSRFLTSIIWGSGLDFDGFWREFWERFGGLGGSLGRLFGGEVTSLKLPSQKNEVPRGDLEGFWLNLEAPGLDFRSISWDFWGPVQG